MIPQDAVNIARHVRGTFASLLLLAGLPAMAGELPPFDAPLEEGWSGPSPLDDPSALLPEFNTSLPVIEDEPVTQPSGPDYAPPAIDAYVDLSFTNSTFDALGFNDGSGGYRFIAGWLLESAGSAGWRFGPELGYSRLGTTERSRVTVDRNITRPGYDTTRTDTVELDASALDFGLRTGYALHPRIEGFLRGGLGFYHSAQSAQTTRTYVPNTSCPAPCPPAPADTQLASSVSDSGVSPFISGGINVRIGDVPSIYVEYGTRRFDQEQVDTGAVGFLLNF